MPERTYKSKQMIVMRRDLKMRKGKIAAQAGHACVEATLMALVRENRLDQVRVTESGNWVYLEDDGSESTPLTRWFDKGVAKVCVYVDGEEALLEVAQKGKELGFAVHNDENYAGHIEWKAPDTPASEYFGIVGHLDVVPVGGGWDSDPRAARRRAPRGPAGSADR